MSNSLPRTMRRKAAISGSTSTKSKEKLFGLTVPSLSARLLPWVRVTVLSLSSGIGSENRARVADDGNPCSISAVCHLYLDRRLRHAGTRGQRLLGGILERLIGGQHHRSRAHPM